MTTTTNKQFIINGKVLKTPQAFGEELINLWAAKPTDDTNEFLSEVVDYLGTITNKPDVLHKLCDITAKVIKQMFGTEDGERVFQMWCITQAANAYERVCDEDKQFSLDEQWNLVNLATAGFLEAQDITIVIAE